MSKINVNTWEPESGTAATLMASGDTVTVPSGAALTIASGATITNSGTATGFGGDNTPSFSVDLSANQSIANSTWTKITFDREQWDTDSAFASNKFTVPSGEAGKYLFCAGTRIAGLDNEEQLSTKFVKNGSDVERGQVVFASPGSGHAGWNQATITLDLAVSDYIEFYVHHNEGASQDATAGYTFMSGFKLVGV